MVSLLSLPIAQLCYKLHDQFFGIGGDITADAHFDTIHDCYPLPALGYRRC